jgi:hypothetical protein
MLLALPAIAALALVGVLLVYAGVLAAGVLQSWLLEMSALTALLGLLVVLPAALFPRLRRICAAAMFVASCLFGLTALAWGALVTFHAWGLGAVFAGLLLLGIGVVAMGMLAALVKGAWITLAGLALLTVGTVAARLASRKLLANSRLAELRAVDHLHVLGGQPRAELGEQAAVGSHAPGIAESHLAGGPRVAVGDHHLAGPASGGAVGREQLL